MSLKTLKTKRHIIKTEKSSSIDVTAPGLINIDGTDYCIQGAVAKFILELTEEADSLKNQVKFYEKLNGEVGKS